MTTHKALVVEDDSKVCEEIDEILTALGHEYDRAGSLLEANKHLRTNGYSYVLLDWEIPARPGGMPRVQNAENFMDDLRMVKGSKLPPVVVMMAPGDCKSELALELIRLSAGLTKRGAVDFIGKPFVSAGRTLDRVIKKILSIQNDPPRSPYGKTPLGPVHSNIVPLGQLLPLPIKKFPPPPLGSLPPRRKKKHSPAPESAPAKVSASQKSMSGKISNIAGAVPEKLTEMQMTILEAMAENPHKTLILAEIIVSGGYGKHATRRSLEALSSLGFVDRPLGERKGFSITTKGKEFMTNNRKLKV